MSWRPILILVAAALSVTRTAFADPANAVLSLDSLSFVANVLDNGEQIPISSIPVRVESQSGNSWSLTIEPEDVHLSPVTFDNGERMQWTLLEPAIGSASLVNGVADVTLSAHFKATSLATMRSVEHQLSFTTRTAEATQDDLSVSREGVPLDRSSGYVQLVAAASDPPGSEHAIPFFVVLSGRFTSGPSGFLAP